MTLVAHPAAGRGALAGVACFLFWGLVAVYWKWIAAIDPLELVLHRTVWSLLFLLLLLAGRGQLGKVAQALRSPRLLALNALSGTLLMANWLTFIWAVIHGRVLESSLGYFLVPLYNVAAGCLLLRERPRRAQWLAIACAAAGVLWLLLGVGHVPWVAIALVVTWGSYGLVRKQSPMGAIDGLTVETLLFTPPAAGYLIWLAAHGQGALGHATLQEHVLVLCSGWVTAIPLVWFAYAAARIRMTTLGLLQYISPSLQFLLGWLWFAEPFDLARLQAYLGIWLGLLIYSVDGAWAQRRSLLQAAGMGPGRA